MKRNKTLIKELEKKWKAEMNRRGELSGVAWIYRERGFKSFWVILKLVWFDRNRAIYFMHLAVDIGYNTLSAYDRALKENDQEIIYQLYANDYITEI